MRNGNMMRRALMGLGAGTALAAAFGGSARAEAPKRWQPVPEPQDQWLEEMGGRHRLVVDTTSTDGLGHALAFANNFFVVNQASYGIEAKDLALVIILRHMSTPFGFNDAMWTKYGAEFSERLKLTDPATKVAPLANLFNIAAKNEALANGGVTFDTLAQKGARFAVCATATKGMAGMIAKESGGTQDAIFAELTTNLVPNGRMVPAGIVALNRAQEHGYTFSYAG